MAVFKFSKKNKHDKKNVKPEKKSIFGIFSKKKKSKINNVQINGSQENNFLEQTTSNFGSSIFNEKKELKNQSSTEKNLNSKNGSEVEKMNLDQPSLIDKAILTSIERNQESNIFQQTDDYFDSKNNKKSVANKSTSLVNTYGIPTNIKYDYKATVEKNLSFDYLYTKKDIESFNLSEDQFVKFFKNGSVFYKLKNPLDHVEIYGVFKSNTKFSKSTVQHLSDTKMLNIKKGELFSQWDDYSQSFNDVLKVTSDDSEKRSELKNKIFKLNQEIEEKLNEYKNLTNSIENDQTSEIILNHKIIEKKQTELNDKIYELKDSFSNTDIFYRVKNLFFNTWNENDMYFGYRLEDISFDIYPNDKIVIVSDNSVTNQLLIDVLRGDEQKSSGYIYKNLTRKKQWIDVADLDFNFSKLSNIDLNEELLYGLASPDYLSFGIKKKDNASVSMKKIFSALGKTPNENVTKKLISLMQFENHMERNVFELDDLNFEKFVTICDILIGKKMVLIKSICQGMAFNEKIQLLNFLNNYFTNNNVTVVYASDDYNDIDIFASKMMLLKQGQIVAFKSIEKILKEFNSIGEAVIHNLKYGIVKEFNQETLDELL